MNSVQVFKPRSNVFDLSHDVKLSTNMGLLVPTCCIDAIPGDKFRIGCNALVRLAPMVFPMMHRCDVTMHYYAVPKRLLWDNWGNYITKTEVDGAVPAPPFITYTAGDYAPGNLMDNLGLPDPGANNFNISPMAIMAYHLICDEYYRDQNLQDPMFFKLEDGDNNAKKILMNFMRRRCWEHDYFTAALPTPQKGDSVEIPVSGLVVLNNDTTAPFSVVSADGLSAPLGDLQSGGFVGNPLQTDTGTGTVNTVLNPNGRLEVQNADTNINDLRRAYALQRFQEKLMRGGSRLTEFIRNIFGVTSSDARLQRPEYITGIKAPIAISEVLNTTGTDDAPQGAMAGHGAAGVSGKYGSFFCEEHCYIIGIMSVMPKTAYQQGIPKHFLKVNDSTEHFTPDFANIGEQEVINAEVYAPHTDEFGVFGYMPRYGEYKTEQNRVAGQFKTTMKDWHMGRIFESDPNLNEEFVSCNPTTRVFAVTDAAEHHVWCHIFNDISAVRLMPKYGTPTY